jgi:hypothetical protein
MVFVGDQSKQVIQFLESNIEHKIAIKYGRTARSNSYDFKINLMV